MIYTYYSTQRKNIGKIWLYFSLVYLVFRTTWYCTIIISYKILELRSEQHLFRWRHLVLYKFCSLFYIIGYLDLTKTEIHKRHFYFYWRILEDEFIREHLEGLFGASFTYFFFAHVGIIAFHPTRYHYLTTKTIHV